MVIYPINTTKIKTVLTALPSERRHYLSGGGGLVQIEGWPPFFMHGLKGAGH